MRFEISRDLVQDWNLTANYRRKTDRSILLYDSILLWYLYGQLVHAMPSQLETPGKYAASGFTSITLRIHEIKLEDIGWLQVKSPPSYGITRKNENFFHFLFRDKILLTLFILSFNFFSCHRAMLKHCHWAICSHMSSKNIKVFFFLLSGPQLENWPAENALRRANILKESHIVLLSSSLAPTSPPSLSYHSTFLAFSVLFQLQPANALCELTEEGDGVEPNKTTAKKAWASSNAFPLRWSLNSKYVTGHLEEHLLRRRFGSFLFYQFPVF